MLSQLLTDTEKLVDIIGTIHVTLKFQHLLSSSSALTSLREPKPQSAKRLWITTGTMDSYDMATLRMASNM
jgi:hypothetical protein